GFVPAVQTIIEPSVFLCGFCVSVAISSEDSPKIFPKIDAEAPSPISQSARNIESDRIEECERAKSNRREPATFQSARSLVAPNGVRIRREFDCRRRLAVTTK